MEGYKDTPLGKIPKSWKVVKISDVADINKNSLPNTTDRDYEFYYIDLSSVKSGNIEFPTEKVNYADSPSRARRILKKEDVIMATVRPNLLGFGYANFETEQYICSTGFALISHKANSDGKYIYQNLYSSTVISQINKLIVGSNYPAINSSDVGNLRIPLPPLQEQGKIAEILSTVDAKIEVIDQQITETQELKKGLMQRLLTKGIGHTEFKDSPLGKIPKSWEVVRSSNVFELIHGFQFRDYDFTEIGLPIVKIGQINTKGEIDMTGCSYFSSDRAEEFANKRIFNGDVLMALTGATLGKSCWVDGLKNPVYQNYRVGKFVPHDENVLSKQFLYFLIGSPLALDQIMSKINSGAQGNVGKSDFEKLKITLPPIEEQHRITSILSSVDEKLSILEEKKVNYQELKKA